MENKRARPSASPFQTGRCQEDPELNYLSQKKKSKCEVDRPFRIGFDDSKGRILIATRDLKVGDILFHEKPLVAGSWHTHRCIECHSIHDSSSCIQVKELYPEHVASNLQRIESLLAEMPAIEELDRARAFIKVLNICRQKPSVINEILKCTAVNMDACRDCIRDIRSSKVTRVIIPESINDDLAASILAVLNTNSHELGEWGGSGLFPLACIMEHSCIPNCNFTPYECGL
jgi:hypothetical protein